MTAKQKFTEEIDDCEGAQWYLLRQTVHARGMYILKIVYQHLKI